MAMKGKLGAMMALFGAMAMTSQHPGQIPNEIASEPRELSRREIEERERKVMEGRGLTQYFFGDNYVWALNYKSAKKKAHKKGYTL